MKKKDNSPVTIGVVVSAEMRQQLRDIAQAENRPLANLIRIVLTEWLEARS